MRGVERDLKAQSLLARSKAAATGSPGSDTAPQLMRALALETVVPGAGFLKFGFDTGNRQIKEAQRKALVR